MWHPPIFPFFVITVFETVLVKHHQGITFGRLNFALPLSFYWAIPESARKFGVKIEAFRVRIKVGHSTHFFAGLFDYPLSKTRTFLNFSVFRELIFTLLQKRNNLVLEKNRMQKRETAKKTWYDIATKNEQRLHEDAPRGSVLAENNFQQSIPVFHSFSYVLDQKTSVRNFSLPDTPP